MCVLRFIQTAEGTIIAYGTHHCLCRISKATAKQRLFYSYEYVHCEGEYVTKYLALTHQTRV